MASKLTAADLQRLKVDLGSLRDQRAKLEGRLSVLMEQLNKQHGLGSVEEAEAKLEELREQAARTIETLDELLGQLSAYGEETDVASN